MKKYKIGPFDLKSQANDQAEVLEHYNQTIGQRYKWTIERDSIGSWYIYVVDNQR